MRKLEASVVDGGLAKDDVFRIHLVEVLRLLGKEPYEVADTCAVGKMSDDTDLPRSHGEFLKTQDASFHLNECLCGEFVDGIELGTVHMLVWIVLQQVAVGLDAQFPLQQFLPLGADARQVFDVLRKDVIHEPPFCSGKPMLRLR